VQNFDPRSPGRPVVKLEEETGLTGPAPVLYTTGTLNPSYSQALCTAPK